MPSLPIQRTLTFLRSFTFTVGTSPVQVSGGTGILSGVDAAFIPDRNRQMVRYTNTHPTQNIFIGGSSSLANTATGKWEKELTPGQYWEDLASGSVVTYIVGSGAGTNVTLAEYM